MEVKRNLSRIIAIIVLILIIILISVESYQHSKPIEGQGEGDTVAASVFAPKTSGELKIDLYKITSVRFPKYKLSKAEPFFPDSVSIAEDEENVASGNYAATLLLDSIPGKSFYEMVDSRAQHDTCWEINKFAYTYQRREKNGGVYKVSFSKGGQQIFVAHQN